MAKNKKNDCIGKGEFIAKMVECGLSKAEAEKSLNTVLDIVRDSLLAGKDVSLTGIGKFHVTNKAARMGRNPRTGEPVKIKPCKSVKFGKAAPLAKALKGQA